jgi:hypothetical protein
MPVEEPCCPGAFCMFEDSTVENQPCWGKIDLEGYQDDIAGFVHTCEGHRYMHEGYPREKYKPELVED